MSTRAGPPNRCRATSLLLQSSPASPVQFYSFVIDTAYVNDDSIVMVKNNNSLPGDRSTEFKVQAV